jgi:folylpolyglutamate synthase/dihydropteroate synthase
MAKKYQKNIIHMPSVQSALGYLQTKIDDTTAIIITGSFYLWNEVKV